MVIGGQRDGSIGIPRGFSQKEIYILCSEESVPAELALGRTGEGACAHVSPEALPQ